MTQTVVEDQSKYKKTMNMLPGETKDEYQKNVNKVFDKMFGDFDEEKFEVLSIEMPDGDNPRAG